MVFPSLFCRYNLLTTTRDVTFNYGAAVHSIAVEPLSSATAAHRSQLVFAGGAGALLCACLCLFAIAVSCHPLLESEEIRSADGSASVLTLPPPSPPPLCSLQTTSSRRSHWTRQRTHLWRLSTSVSRHPYPTTSMR